MYVDRMFFNEHRRFLETSTTSAERSRLNWRHLAIIEDNVDLLRGKDVIDIASHDGRWTFAALRAGARHVTGIAARALLVQTAEDTLRSYNVPAESFRFITGDVFAELDAARTSPLRADVVMCLGFLYHTVRYPELLLGIRATGAEYVVIDTAVSGMPNRVVRLVAENVENDNNAAPGQHSFAGKTLTGRPTRSALEYMLDAFGFDVVKKFDWQQALSDQQVKAVTKYRRGRRVTWVARVRPGAG